MTGAVQKVRLGEVSRGAQTLTAGKLAPGTPDTLRALKAQRTEEPARGEELPAEVANYVPAAPVKLDEKLFLSVFPAAPKVPLLPSQAGGMNA